MTTFETLPPDQQRVAIALLKLQQQEGVQFRAKYQAENLKTGEKFEGTGTFILPATLEDEDTYEYRHGQTYYVIPKEEILLETTFGQVYLKYKSEVRKWF